MGRQHGLQVGSRSYGCAFKYEQGVRPEVGVLSSCNITEFSLEMIT